MSELKKITNPFVQHKGNAYNCFGCSPNNDIGFNLEFYAEEDVVMAKWLPKSKYEGYMNVVHGGIQATLMDEIASWYIYAMLDTAGVTNKLEVQYHKPLYVSGGEVLIKAALKERKNKHVMIKTEIVNSKGLVISSADVEYYLFPPNVARVKYMYPGIEAFWE